MLEKESRMPINLLENKNRLAHDCYQQWILEMLLVLLSSVLLP